MGFDKKSAILRAIILVLIIDCSVRGSEGFSSNASTRDGQLDTPLPPTLELVILIHAYNKAKVLPFTLGGIESQEYPKHRINIYMRTEEIAEETTKSNHSHELQKQYNQITLKMLSKWIEANENKYHDIDLQISEREAEGEGEGDGDAKEYWTQERFQRIINAKERAMKVAKNKWADFVLFLDADVVLTNPNTFREMIINRKERVISPMLYSLGTYSNFWAGITDKGYYTRTEDYIPILERQKVGVFEVPMIHSCLFVDLRVNETHSLSFNPNTLENVPYDDIIAFALSAKKMRVPLFVDNNQVWGYIPPPIESLDLDDLYQDIIDLELESLVEGPSFPLASSLVRFFDRPPKDKLGVDNVYTVNLIRRPERLQRMQTCFEVTGIDSQVWPAVDGQELREEGLKNLGVSVMPGYLDPYHKRPMTYGEIGCFLSHFFIWKDIVQRNFSQAIILEDDVRFERNFKRRLREAISKLDLSRVDFIYLGRKRQGEAKDEMRVKTMFVRPVYSYWTIGYFLTQRGAEKLLAVHPLANVLPVDEFLPIMFDEHPTEEWKRFYPKRNLKALSFDPVLITPTHYVGDEQYISDTEESLKLPGEKYPTNNKQHPKHTEL